VIYKSFYSFSHNILGESDAKLESPWGRFKKYNSFEWGKWFASSSSSSKGSLIAVRVIIKIKNYIDYIEDTWESRYSLSNPPGDVSKIIYHKRAHPNIVIDFKLRPCVSIKTQYAT